MSLNPEATGGRPAQPVQNFSVMSATRTLDGPQPLPIPDPSPAFPVALPIPDFVPADFRPRIESAFAHQQRELERIVDRGHVRPDGDSTIHIAGQRLFEALSPAVIKYAPELVKLRKELNFIGDQKSQAYSEAVIEIQNQAAVVNADLRKAIGAWIADTINHTIEAHEALMAQRGADALVAVATLGETASVYDQALALLESIRASHTGASIILAKSHPLGFGRFDPRHAARQFGEALDMLRRAKPPIADIRKRLYPADAPKARGRKIKRGEAFEDGASPLAEGIAV